MLCNRREFTRYAGLAALGSIACTGSARGSTIYTVREGDTLGLIAQRHGISTAELRRANKISGDLIRVGQKLTVPGTLSATSSQAAAAKTYLVKRGDTLGSIARMHGCSVDHLKRANNLSGDLIRVGQKLVVPGPASSADLLARVRAETARIDVRASHWKRIVAHHSAIKYGNATIYDKAHRKRGMQNGLAYHFIIGNGIDSGDGEIEVGPRWKQQLLGGHVKNHAINLSAIGICLVGNFEERHPSRRQLEAFTQLMDWLQRDVLRRKVAFAGHRELNGEQTICPGKHFPLAAMHARYD